MMKFKSIFKPAAAVLAAAIALASCEVDTTTVMFEEDHNFSDPTDTVFSMLENSVPIKTLLGINPARIGNANPGSAPNNKYKTKYHPIT